MRMLSFKMRNLRGLKNAIFHQQSRAFFQSSAFRNSRPELFYEKFYFIICKFQKIHRKKPVSESFFDKFASLSLLKTDSGTRVFL